MLKVQADFPNGKMNSLGSEQLMANGSVQEERKVRGKGTGDDT